MHGLGAANYPGRGQRRKFGHATPGTAINAPRRAPGTVICV